MAINPFSAALPATPIADEAGNVTTAWRGYFMALLSRTGGGTGVSAGDMSARLDAERAARIQADLVLGVGLSNEATARAGADATEQSARIAGDAVLAEKVSDGGFPMDFEQQQRLAGDAQSRAFAFFLSTT